MRHAVSIPTEAGEFVAHFTERGLAAIDFPGRKRVESRSELRVEKTSAPQFSIRTPLDSQRKLLSTLNTDSSQLSTQIPLNSLAVSPDFPGWEQPTAMALRAALAGKSAGRLPPFDWRGATEFQQSIWRALLRIPTGRTSTYAELAAAAGHPRAVRAAGSACGANPIPVLVPCHRVVASGGKLGGFSGGLDWKRRLLAREGVELES